MEIKLINTMKFHSKFKLFSIVLIASTLSLLTTCKKDELSEDEKLTQHEEKILEKMNDFMPIEVKSLYEDYFNSIHGEVNNDLYLDSLESALDELKNSIQLNYNLEDYKKALSNSLTSLESSGKGSIKDCLGLGYAKGVSIEGAISGTLGYIVVAGLEAYGGGGVKIIYDFVNQERQIYTYTFCGSGYSIGVGIAAILKANLGFTGTNEIITGIRYRGNNSGLNSFEGQEIGNSFSIDPNVSLAFGGGVSIGAGIGIGTSHEAVADFSVTDNLSFCPEYKVEIENGVKSASLQVSGNISAAVGFTSFAAYVSLNTTMTNSTGVTESYKKFSSNRILAGILMAKEICTPKVEKCFVSVPNIFDLAASTIALLYSYMDVTGCPAEIPAIGTRPIKNIQSTSATSGGIITDNRGASVISSGVCWSTSQNPTIDNYRSSDGTEIGSYESTLTGLKTNTTYYVRAYATNKAGTAYGKQVSFTTAPGNQSGTVIDRDGNTYGIVTIGNQTWLRENLKVTRYNDGTSIPNITLTNTWRGLTSGAYCDYNNDATNGQIYGHLYNFYVVTNTKKVCPSGWHVPSDDEWKTLEKFLGMSQMEADKSGERGTTEGGKLKETGMSHWLSPNTGATNSSGFTALPGSYLDGNTGTWANAAVHGFWWTATNRYYRGLHYDYSTVWRYTHPATSGFSIRCVRD
jgi:uncharacterized protein (TIGR02145 family)